jgi:hypothetical protein
MISRKLLLLALVAFFPSQPGFTHSGRTNADGCHTNHSTGDYHCHGSRQPAAGATTYCHVIDGERRCGYAYSSCSSLVSRFGGYCQRE